MADVKISALPASTTPLAGTEVLPIVQGGVTKKVSVDNLTAGRTVNIANLEASGYGSFYNAVNVLSGKPLYLYPPANNNYWALSEDSSNNFLLKNVTSTVLSATPAGNVSVAFGNLSFTTAGKGLVFAGNNSVTWSCGAGSPETVVTAPVGSLFTRTDGGANTTLYVKESGAGNTGWVAK